MYIHIYIYTPLDRDPVVLFPILFHSPRNKFRRRWKLKDSARDYGQTDGQKQTPFLAKYVECEAPKIAKIAKLVQITPITMIYGT